MRKKILQKAAVLLAVFGISAFLISCYGAQPVSDSGGEFQPAQASQPALASSPAVGPDWLLPDVTPLVPSQMYIERNESTGRRELRFDTTIANIGDGAMELVGEYDKESGMDRAVQRIYTGRGTVEEVTVGYFIFHPEHTHWHFEGFALVELFSLGPDGLPDQLAAAAQKISFCVYDVFKLPDSIQGAPASPIYSGCDPVIQGISVGWADIYAASLPGQQFDIENIPDGRYLVRSTADPDDLILETDNENNSSEIYIEIKGMEVFY